MAKRLVYAEVPRNYSVMDELVFALQKLNRMKREDDCWKTIPDVSKFFRGRFMQNRDDKQHHSMSDSADQSNERRSRVMKKSKCLLVVSAIAFPFVMGCGSSTEQTKESTTTTYIPTSPAIVVAPPPVVTTAPLPPATTSSSTEEDNSDSYSSNSRNVDTNESERAKSSYHSETTTISPPAPAQVYRPPSSTEESTTTTTTTY
jgi:hypothetical protein